MGLEVLYITVNGEKRSITTPKQFEETIRELVRDEVSQMGQKATLLRAGELPFEPALRSAVFRYIQRIARRDFTS